MSSIAPVWQEIRDTLAPRSDSTEGILPPLMILLTIVTGIVDALAYLKLGHVFVANMTGNVVFLGFAAAGASGLSVAGSLLALGCFLPGGVAASRLAARLGENRLRQLRFATAAELTLCVAATTVAAIAGDQLGSGSRYTLIALLALALGVQNATARRLAVADLTTTVLTLTLTGIAADSWLGGGSGAHTARRLLSVAAMFAGAVIGALLLLEVAPVAPLALATAILAIVAAAAHRGSRQPAEIGAPGNRVRAAIRRGRPPRDSLRMQGRCPASRQDMRTRREHHRDHARARAGHPSPSDPLGLRRFRAREDPPVPAPPALVPGW